MQLLFVFIILIFLMILGIAVSSIIINIVNRISSGLDDTNYKENKNVDCSNNILIIDQAQNLLSAIRVMAAIVLTICIVVVIFIIIGIIITAKTAQIFNDIGGDSTITRLFTNRIFIILLLGSLTVIFLAFSIGYAILLGLMNNIDVEKCIEGSAIDEESPLGRLNSAKNLVIIQMVVCLIMFVVSLVIMIIMIVVTGKKKIKEQFGDLRQFANEDKPKGGFDLSKINFNIPKPTSKDQSPQ